MSTPSTTLRTIADLIDSRYVFADVGNTVAESLRSDVPERWSAMEAVELAPSVTEHLLARTGDRHLRLRWEAEVREESGEDEWDDPEFLAAYWREQDYVNQGIPRAEVLAGNIGLLVCQSLDEAEGTGHVVEAAIAFLGRCDALIVDVRDSNGGAPSGVAHLISHLVDAPAKHLLDVVDREGRTVEQTWTTPYVRTRLERQPVFVATSASTPSGAEELAYDLQALGRAAVVGEPTVGAANPVQRVTVAPHLFLQLPTQRVVSAVTGRNWEGEGVIPDVRCEAGESVAVAHQLAARALLEADDFHQKPASVQDAIRTVAGTVPRGLAP